MTTSVVKPGYLCTVPPGGLEGPNDAQKWWVVWLVLRGLLSDGIALGAKRYRIYHFQWMPGSAQPRNWWAAVNDHVSGSNPAANGVAVSPVQNDWAAYGAGVVGILTHGGGTYDAAIDQYHDVIKTAENDPVHFHHVPWQVGPLYSVFLETTYDPDPAVGYVRAWLTQKEQGLVKLLADGHASTFYNEDPGPLDQYLGGYCKGGPAESAQANNDQATFQFKLWLPQESDVGWADCMAAPSLTLDHARGALKKAVFTCVPCESLQLADVLIPPEVLGGAPAPTPTPTPPSYAVTQVLTAAGVDVADGSLHAGDLTWMATVNDQESGAVTSAVSFYVDGVKQMGRDETTAPYGCTNVPGADSDLGRFDTTLIPDGGHYFSVTATSTDGRKVTGGGIHVRVQNQPPSPVVDVAGALTAAQAALTHLRASNGYKNAKKANPKPASFAATEVGQCETQLLAAIKKLGG